MKNKYLLAINVLAGSMVMGISGASAQSIAGKAQLGLDVGILSYTHVALENNDTNTDTSVNSVGFGMLESGMMRGGYMIGEHFLIGGLVELSYKNVSPEDSDDSSDVDVNMAVMTEYIFSGRAIRPFVGVNAGVGFSGEESGNTSTSTVAFVSTLRGGIHAFLTDSVSLDPSAEFGLVVGGSTIDSGASETDLSLVGFGFGLNLGLSVWL